MYTPLHCHDYGTRCRCTSQMMKHVNWKSCFMVGDKGIPLCIPLSCCPCILKFFQVPFYCWNERWTYIKIIIYLFIYIFTKNKRKVIVQEYQHGIFFHKLLYSEFVSCKTYQLFYTNKSNEFLKYVCDRQLPIITTGHLWQSFCSFVPIRDRP